MKIFDHQTDNVTRPWLWVFIVSYIGRWLFLFHRIDLFSPWPIVNFDYIEYYARILRIEQFLKHGHYWGYDPFEMAGYPAILREMGVYFFAVITSTLAPLFSTKSVLLFFEVIGHLGLPLLIIPTIRCFGGSKENATVGFAFLALTYGSLDSMSLVGIKTGFMGFVFACFVAIWNVGLLWRWLADEKISTWVWWTVSLAIIPQLHPSALVVNVIPITVLLLAHIRWMRLRDIIALVATGLIVVCTNWYWIQPYLAYSTWIERIPYFGSFGGFWFLNSIVPLQATWFFSVRGLVGLALLNVCTLSFEVLWGRARLLAVTLAVWILWLGLLVFAGNHIPYIELIQPFRFTLAFWMVVVVTAALGYQSLSYPLLLKKIFGWLIPVALLAGWCETVYVSRQFPPFTTHLSSAERPLLEEIWSGKPPAGRWMVESGGLFDSSVSDIGTVFSKRPLLGGPDTGNFLKSRFTTLMVSIQFRGTHGDAISIPTVFGRPLSTFIEDETLFRDYLNLYNVSRIAARSPEIRKILGSLSDVLVPVEQKGAYMFFDLRDPSLSWFVKGSGNLSMDYDELKITNASPGDLVLKCHWIEQLQTDPPLPMKGIYLMADPVPFIEIDNSSGQKEIRIYNKGL